MDKKFIKSMVTAIAGLSIISSCSAFSKKDSHKCGAQNGCAAAKAEAKPAKAKKASKAKKAVEKSVEATPAAKN